MKRVTPAVLVLLAVCQSPEASRTVGGVGADIRNRPPNIEIHGGSLMYSRTPCRLPGNQCPGPMPISGLKTDYPQP